MDDSTLDRIAEFVCGNGEKYPVYRSSSQLTGFFARAGLPRFVHDGSTRQRWVLQCLQQCNRNELADVLRRLASPREYGGEREHIAAALKLLNDALYVEGVRVVLSGLEPKFEKVTIDYNDVSAEDLQPLPPPDFLSLNLEPGIGEILEHRWSEAQRCVDAQAFLSATIIMGSLLEGLLLAVCQKNPAQANVCTCAPKDYKTGKVKHFADWKLSEMIDVGHEADWLGLDVKKFAHSLREFRNIIHPYQHMLMGTTPDEDTCKISWLVVQASVNDLAKVLENG